MSNWTITVLYYGRYFDTRSRNNRGLDEELIVEYPFQGFLLRNGTENVLVDTGLSDDTFQNLDQKEYGFQYGRQLIIDELAKEGLTPEDINTVIYTHLHFDHCGNPDMFPDAVTYVQKSEYENLQKPYDFQILFPPEILPWTLERLNTVKDIRLVDGDIKLDNGLELYKVEGHSPGGQVIVVPTDKGRYVLTGDTPAEKSVIFPQLDKMVLKDGTEISITPATEGSGRYLLGSGIWDAFAAYDSYDKVLSLAEKPEPEFFICSHWPENVFRRYFG